METILLDIKVRVLKYKARKIEQVCSSISV